MRRIGTSPAERGCGENNSCPDVLERADGEFVVVGKLPERSEENGLIVEMQTVGARPGRDEAVVILPREVILAAARQLADEGATE